MSKRPFEKFEEYAKTHWRNVGELVEEYQPGNSRGYSAGWIINNDHRAEIDGNLYIDKDFMEELKKHSDLLDKMHIKGEIMVVDDHSGRFTDDPPYLHALDDGGCDEKLPSKTPEDSK